MSQKKEIEVKTSELLLYITWYYIWEDIDQIWKNAVNHCSLTLTVELMFDILNTLEVMAI